MTEHYWEMNKSSWHQSNLATHQNMSCAIVCHTFSLLLSRFVLAEHLTFRKKLIENLTLVLFFSNALSLRKLISFRHLFLQIFFCGQNSCTSCVITKIVIYWPFILFCAKRNRDLYNMHSIDPCVWKLFILYLHEKKIIKESAC